MRSERVLVSLKPYLGDAVMVQPATEALASAGAEVYVQASPGGAEILGATGCRHVPFSKSKSLGSIARDARELRERGFQSVVLVNLSFRSALTCRLAKIPRRVGHATEGRGFLLTHQVPFDPCEFQACSIGRLLEPLGLDVMKHRPRLAFPGSEKLARDLLRGATIGFHAGARDPWKRLPIRTIVEVLDGLRKAGHKFAMFGGKEEAIRGRLEEGSLEAVDRTSTEEVFGTVAEGLLIHQHFKDDLVDLVGRTSIPETVAAFAQLRASFGGDTGVMHLSAASGCPTVQVFGSNRASRWGHAYAPHRVLEAPGGDLTKISPEEILRAVLEFAG